MNVAGLIFANIHDRSLPELTQVRNMASVPFGGRYRLIDFTLSNMVNSGITKVGIITHYNYQSLLDHLGNGKDWDLARREGGIKLIPPNVSAAGAGHLPSSRLESMLSAIDFITHCNEDYLVLSDCDIICNLDLSDVIAAHAASGADVTFVTKRVDASGMYLSESVGCVKADENGRITEFVMKRPTDGVVNIYTNIMVVTREYLISMLSDAAARGYTSFFHDVIAHVVADGTANYRAYEYEGWYAYVSSLEGYFNASMKLLTQEARDGLFAVANRPVLTKVRNSSPTKYCEGAKVTDSVVADGCIIEGTVENSILFRGVKVGRGTVVKNCILMQDTYTGSDAELNCIVTDKNVVIRDGRCLSGCETMPIFIGKGRYV
ncbi:MAG: glucose-1-phosphate adenylyltransferase subunit GlgD [Clostridia bacterium]|nr:glucose-1-phosphate adenylyltransferase subunit GlgD [Clostridia bacterium]